MQRARAKLNARRSRSGNMLSKEAGKTSGSLIYRQWKTAFPYLLFQNIGYPGKFIGLVDSYCFDFLFFL